MGEMKIPDPMMMPMMMEDPCKTPISFFRATPPPPAFSPDDSLLITKQLFKLDYFDKFGNERTEKE